VVGFPHGLESPFLNLFFGDGDAFPSNKPSGGVVEYVAGVGFDLVALVVPVAEVENSALLTGFE